MALWKKMWLLFTAIWLVLMLLQVGTILGVGEEPPEKIFRPIALGIAVPAAAYLALWAWNRFRR
jgi:hypothetical protein